MDGSGNKALENIASAETMRRLITRCSNVAWDFIDDVERLCKQLDDYTLYTKLTGMPGPSVPVGTVVKNAQPVVIPCRQYKINLEFPNLTAAGAGKRQVIDDIINDAVIDQVIIPELEAQGITDYFYYKQPSIDRQWEEPASAKPVKKLNANMMRLLEPIIREFNAGLLNGLEMYEPDFHRGSRLNVEYSVLPNRESAAGIGLPGSAQYSFSESITDDEGTSSVKQVTVGPLGVRHRIDNVRREYLRNAKGYTFTVPVHSMSQEDKDKESKERTAFVKSLLPYIILSKVIHKNLVKSDHPECSNLFSTDYKTGRVTLTEEGNSRLMPIANRLSERLANLIADAPGVSEGCLVQVDADLLDGRLSEPVLRNVMFDPTVKFPVKDSLPDTEGCDTGKRCSRYEKKARLYALNAISNNLMESGHPHFDRYFRAVKLRPDSDVKAPFGFTKKGLHEFRRVYDKLTDVIVDALESLDENKSVPFYLEATLASREKADITIGKVVLDSRLRDYVLPPVDSKVAPGERLTEESIDEMSALIIDNIANYVLDSHLAGLEHPLHSEWFVRAPGSGWTLLTEEGAVALEGNIDDISARFMKASLGARMGLPEGTGSYRLVMDYSVDGTGLMKGPRPVLEYFSNEGGLDQFRLDDIASKTDGMSEDDKLAEMRRFYRDTVGKGIATMIIARNMHRSSHPAFGDYFVLNGSAMPTLTEKGSRDLGSLIEKCSESIAQDIIGIAGVESGGIYSVQYCLGRSGFEYIQVEPKEGRQ